jgi:hypothetical protein
MPHSLNMSLNLLSRHALRSKQTSQRSILTRNGPRNTLHLQRSLAIATLELTNAILQIIEQFTLSCTRATLVLAIESERLGGSSLFGLSINGYTGVGGGYYTLRGMMG